MALLSKSLHIWKWMLVKCKKWPDDDNKRSFSTLMYLHCSTWLYCVHIVVMKKSYLCVCFDFVPQIMTESESCFAALSTFTALTEIILCGQMSTKISSHSSLLLYIIWNELILPKPSEVFFFLALGLKTKQPWNINKLRHWQWVTLRR